MKGENAIIAVMVGVLLIIGNAANVLGQNVRLMGSTSRQGRVEVFFNAAWGTVCDDIWDLRNGNVVCRMLGYNRVATVYKASFFGEGTGLIGLDNVRCVGNETSIFNCKHNGWGNSNCKHSEDASVACEGCGEPPTIKDGTLEVTSNALGSQASYRCSDGYAMSGNPNITCDGVQTWPTTVPTCIIFDCGRPPVTDNSIRDFSTTTFESTAFYTCYNGFTISGNSTILCQKDGTWEAAPTCIVSVASSHKFTQEFDVTIKINTAFENGLNDVTSSLFLIMKMNVEKRMSALLGYIPGFLYLIVNAFRRGSILVDMNIYINAAMKAEQIQQLIKDTIKNAVIARDIILGDLEIDPNNIQVNNKTTSTSSTTTPPIITTTKTTAAMRSTTTPTDIHMIATPAVYGCGRPPVIVDSVINFSTTTFGSSANYTCGSGFVLTGNAFISCQNDSTWEAAPICTDAATLPVYQIVVFAVSALLVIAILTFFICQCYKCAKKSNNQKPLTGTSNQSSNGNSYLSHVHVDVLPKEKRRASVPVHGNRESSKIPKDVGRQVGYGKFPMGYSSRQSIS